MIKSKSHNFSTMIIKRSSTACYSFLYISIRISTTVGSLIPDKNGKPKYQVSQITTALKNVEELLHLCRIFRRRLTKSLLTVKARQGAAGNLLLEIYGRNKVIICNFNMAKRKSWEIVRKEEAELLRIRILHADDDVFYA